MESYYRYFIITSISLGLFYFAYLLIFKNEGNFQMRRLFILSAIAFSVILPINKFSIELPQLKNHAKETQQTDNLLATKREENKLNETNITAIVQTEHSVPVETITESEPVNLTPIWISIHFIVSSLLIIRMFFSLIKLLYFYIVSTKKKEGNYTYIFLDKRIIPFSFFNWIFIDKMSENEGLDQITVHEKAHAKQIHTIDLMISELLVAAMWFNPFTWVLKKALLQVHEYLADESVLKAGYNKLDYQSLLVNQAAEDRLIAVSSNFSYSSIKKRIIMMSKTKTNGKPAFKSLVLVAVAGILTFGVSCFNTPVKAGTGSMLPSIQPTDTTPREAMKEKEMVAAVAPTKMNVLYVGVDNPVSIAVTGAEKDKIKVSIDNGSIVASRDGYNVRVKNVGITTITVKVEDKTIASYKFRVKKVPNPVAMIMEHPYQTTLTKEELIGARGIKIVMENFDFDLSFSIVSFNISTTFNGFLKESMQKGSPFFSKEQLSIINDSHIGQKIYIEDITVMGPDGAVRKLGALAIKIK